VATSCIENMQDNLTQAQEMTWKNLAKANLATTVPFKLALDTQDASSIECEKILRVIPGKRLIVAATWNDQPVVAKLFYEPWKAKRHSTRELKGIETLLTSGVPTPKLLFHGTAQKKRVSVLLFEHVMEARNLYDVWQEQADLEELTTLMQAVTIELATQHVLGIVQRDLHLKNFLLKNNQILTLDGGSIQCFHKSLAKKPSLDHLGLFFAQLGVGTEQLQQELFQTYVRARGWIVKSVDVRYLQTVIKKWHRRRWQRYVAKLKRSSSAFAKIATPQKWIMYDRNYDLPEFQQFLANPEAIFNQQPTKILKAGRTSTVAKITLDNKVFVVKRYNVKGVWHWLRRSLRPTRAVASWQLAHLLRLFGIPTAKPVACIEKRFLGLRNKSYFVMEYISGAHLGDYFKHYQKEDTRFVTMAARVMALFNNLAKLRISHGDLKMTNILIENERPILIDLDGVTEHRSVKKVQRAYKNEIKRFMQNWEDRPDVKKLFEELI